MPAFTSETLINIPDMRTTRAAKQRNTCISAVTIFPSSNFNHLLSKGNKNMRPQCGMGKSVRDLDSLIATLLYEGNEGRHERACCSIRH